MGKTVFSPTIGFYPQRGEVKKSAIEKRLQLWVGSLLSRFSISQRRGRLMVARVDRFQHLECGCELVLASIPQLQQALSHYRYLLQKQGMTDELLAKLFAIVREIAGRTLGMRYRPHQLIGAWAMLQGRVIEMDTGEGKSFCATLAAASAALMGVRVHVITVNDYLAERDAQKFTEFYAALNLSCAFVGEAMTSDDKRLAYTSAIVYSTNNQVTFDYLRDRLALNNDSKDKSLQLASLLNGKAAIDDLVMQGLPFAIIDEADSVLIDEAVTPLVISASRPGDMRQGIYTKAMALALQLLNRPDEALFHINESFREISLSPEGKQALTELCQKMGSLWQHGPLRDELVVQALNAQKMFIKDEHYVVDAGKICIVDEFTGRIMADRSWQSGLHQMIELKEGCALSDDRHTLARISYQRFFPRYVNLAGMTGTGKEVKSEFSQVYRMGHFRVPPASPSKREHLSTVYCQTWEQKWQQIMATVLTWHQQGKPVLIGTRTVEVSNHLYSLLTAEGFAPQLLNAVSCEGEAEVVVKAGQPGAITIATNMAGRGTDISLTEESRALGGLHVLLTEKHEARRVDRQFFGRCARQGDPGTVLEILSFEDELITAHAPLILKMAVKLTHRATPWVSPWLAGQLFNFCQVRIERRQLGARSQVLKADTHYARMLAFGGTME